MSYKGIKRVLGETNLERKCRFLFGLCLALLITGAFWWVSTVTEKLARDTARITGRRLVDSYMLKYHFNVWENREELKSLVHQMSEDLQLQSYEPQFLTLEDMGKEDVFLPADPEEEEILLKLRKRLLEQREEEADEGGADAELAATGDDVAAVEEPKDIIPIFEERRIALKDDPDEGEYQYYQPVYWTHSCTICKALHRPKPYPAAERAAMFDEDGPFCVVKVAIPDDEMQQAIAWTRAILITAGIVTVFVSMIALYIIVRYVIVKPLTHLRDVSDEISRGNTQLRAEIQTNDEFEDLAASFNRMLRHLTETQAELQNVNVDLDAKVDQLAQVNMQLYEMNRLKSDFLASMSHELRTPLNSIIGFSEVLHGIQALDETQKRYVRNIQKSGRMLLDMINDILDLAKLESGKMEVRPTEFDVRAVITAQCDIVRSLTEEKNIDLECDVPDQGEARLVYQDQSKVQQILTNLLSNAIKFTPEGGRITVTADRDAADLVLTVTDTGVGIAEEDREVIFEKFRQSTAVAGNDSLTREYSGTGLGLSIVKELCILLGGEVLFSSELGKGSAFSVRLPWRMSEPDRRSADGPAAPPEATPRSQAAPVPMEIGRDSTAVAASNDVVGKGSS
jgi:signal transduction histidine kinase